MLKLLNFNRDGIFAIMQVEAEDQQRTGALSLPWNEGGAAAATSAGTSGFPLLATPPEVEPEPILQIGYIYTTHTLAMYYIWSR